MRRAEVVEHYLGSDIEPDALSGVLASAATANGTPAGRPVFRGVFG